MENKQYRIKKRINIKLPKIERSVSISAGRSKLSCTLFYKKAGVNFSGVARKGKKYLLLLFSYLFSLVLFLYAIRDTRYEWGYCNI